MTQEFNYYSSESEWINDYINPQVLISGQLDPKVAAQVLLFTKLADEIDEKTLGILCSLLENDQDLTHKTINLQDAAPILLKAVDLQDSEQVSFKISKRSIYYILGILQEELLNYYNANTKPQSADELLEIVPIKALFSSLNSDYQDAFYRYLLIAPQLPIVTSYSSVRRSFHSSNPYAFIGIFAKILVKFCIFQKYEFKFSEQLLTGELELDGDGFDDTFAYYAAVFQKDEDMHKLASQLGSKYSHCLLNRNQNQLLERLEQNFFESEGVSAVSGTLIKALIASNRDKALELVMKLLKAAKLSEGLRTSIVEEIDAGSVETFKYFLAYIDQENLYRFSSVKRSFITFSGLTESLTDNSILKHAQWLAQGMLNNSANEYLTEKNLVKFYLGLYLTACYDIDDALTIIANRFLSWDKHQQIATLFFLKNAKLPLPATLITTLLSQIDQTELDLELVTSIFSNLTDITFDSITEKREFLAVSLPLLSSIKGSPRYYELFDKCDYPFNSYLISNLYYKFLDLVDDVDDFYELAYSMYSKYCITWNYAYSNMSKRLANPIVHKAIVEAVGTRISDHAKDLLIENEVALDHEDYLILGDFLRLKSSTVRVNIAELIHKADPNTVMEVVLEALKTRNKNKHEGAVGILVDNYERIKDLPQYTEIKELLSNIKFDQTVTEQVAMLLGEETAKPESEAKFYTPVTDIPCPTLTWDESIVQNYLNYDLKAVFAFVEKCYEIFIQHRGEKVECTIYDGSKVVRCVGSDLNYVKDISNHSIDDVTYQDYVFWEDFVPITEKLEDKDCILYQHFISLIKDYGISYYDDLELAIDYGIDNGYLPNLYQWIESWSDNSTRENGKYNYTNNALAVLEMECKRRGLFTDKNSANLTSRQEASRYFANVTAYHIAKEKERIAAGVKLDQNNSVAASGQSYFDEIQYLLNCIIGTNGLNLPWFDGAFVKDLLLNLIDVQKERSYNFDILILFKLENLGLISRDLIYTFLLDTSTYSYKTGNSVTQKSHGFQLLCDLAQKINRDKNYRNYDGYKQLPYSQTVHEVYRNCANYMANIEINRTDKDTPYSQALSRFSEFYGAEIFFKALAKMGKMTFVRGYSWGYEGKKEMFSHIISNAMPEHDLTQERFNELVTSYKIDDNRLLEACIYNLNFIDYAQSYLGIPGLTKAAYYFKAHLNDILTKKEEVIVRRYSDIEFEDFENGQMDLNWFNESYAELGEEKFQWLYDAAKYITEGGKHKRAQYFADAVRGKLDINEVEARIDDKRNQEMILAYGLIPLGMGKSTDREEDARLRYARLQAFLKESKQFGVQRRASEALKVSIAINNLAKNYGLPATRFVWKMEAKLSESQAKYFEPYELGEFTVYIDLERPENPELCVIKADKKLKSVPAKLNKEPYIKELKEVKAEIKDQYRRARTMLENSMCQRTEFTQEELTELKHLPVVAALLRDLVFISDEQVGFYDQGKLKVLAKDTNQTSNFTTVATDLDANAKLRIAHPVDLVEHDWASWQTFVMENEIIQPFKQVFRELYVMTADERQADGYSQRFAGYQVAKNRAMGLLSSRGWMLSDSGFEKVNHQSNLRIELYSYADWYTAGDVEEPSIEKIVFLDNKTGKTWDMSTLDPVIFSETMRDLDLVVSVAHVGGVDPAYEHTTIELRSRILTHNLNLLKIDNYQIDGVHVTINGKLHQYSLHLGSGVIHVAGRGMLPVFPVHSQQRGRIFLPFVDSDPKTAEIVTKVLMLAQDNKIKDPAILKHLR